VARGVPVAVANGILLSMRARAAEICGNKCDGGCIVWCNAYSQETGLHLLYYSSAVIKDSTMQQPVIMRLYMDKYGYDCLQKVNTNTRKLYRRTNWTP